jgi:hypothetical protein
MATSQANLETFQAWSAAKTHEEFLAIVYRGLLNRKEIALQCGFSKSVLAQNPRVHKLLHELETRLRAEGILPLDEDLPDSRSAREGRQDEGVEHRATPPQLEPFNSQADGVPTSQQSTLRKLESLVRRLQSENASQRAEIQELRRQLSRLSAIQEALATSGRLPR